jgi:protein O-mannosyl-transferase
MRRPKTKSNPARANASAPVMARSRFPVWRMAALLALVTIALYWPATSHDFVNFDDNLYITENPHVQGGLNWAGVKWAFFNPVAYNWHPLTMLSHMLDCQLFGLKPWGHHLTSVLLHAVNTVLVFVLLQRLTGALWRSVLVAAVFGLHPLHVESVAWVAERKDVLSTCFALLSLLAYARFVEHARGDPRPAAGKKPNPEWRMPKENRKSNTETADQPNPESDFGFRTSFGNRDSGFGFLDRFYLLSLVFFALGLMSKPMVVTLPFLMLLLDWWPLQRMASGARLIWEKIPFFVLAAGISVVTFVVQKQTGVSTPVENLPLVARGGNALISYCRYLGKLFWPVDLAFFYPHPGVWPLAQVVLAGGLILGLTVLFIGQRRRHPFLLMGWLWYCGTLVPVIGLVQVGNQAMADRYCYVPSLGVLILIIWGICELTRRWRHYELALSVAGGAAIVLCFGMTRQQLEYWKDDETLFRHALEVTENNYFAHNNLGVTLEKKGQTDEAIRQYQEAIRLKPDFAETHSNLGAILGTKGQTDEAISQFQEVIRLAPDDATAHYNLGTAFGIKGQIDEAISQFQEAIRLKPDYAEARHNLAHALEIKKASAAR